MRCIHIVHGPFDVRCSSYLRHSQRMTEKGRGSLPVFLFCTFRLFQQKQALIFIIRALHFVCARTLSPPVVNLVFAFCIAFCAPAAALHSFIRPTHLATIWRLLLSDSCPGLAWLVPLIIIILCLLTMLSNNNAPAYELRAQCRQDRTVCMHAYEWEFILLCQKLIYSGPWPVAVALTCVCLPF